MQYLSVHPCPVCRHATRDIYITCSPSCGARLGHANKRKRAIRRKISNQIERYKNESSISR